MKEYEKLCRKMESEIVCIFVCGHLGLWRDVPARRVDKWVRPYNLFTSENIYEPLTCLQPCKTTFKSIFFARFHDEKGLTLFWRIFLAKQSMFFLSRRCWRCSEAGPWDCCEYSTATLVQLASTARSLSARLMYSCLRKFYKKVLMLEDPNLKYIELNV